MKVLKIIIVSFFLLYYLEVFSFKGLETYSDLMHYILLGVCFGSAVVFAFVARFPKTTIPLYLFGVAFPLVAALQSSLVFGQSFFLGVASLRYEIYVFFALFLILIDYPFETMVRHVNILNLIIAVAAIIAFYFLKIDNVSITTFLVDNEVVDISLDENAFKMKGRFLTTCSNLMVFSYIYYMIQLLKKVTLKNAVCFAILMFYLLFVHKGRMPVAFLAIIFMLYYFRMKRLTPKKLLFSLIPVSILLFVILFGSSYLTRFSAIFQGLESQDFSTQMRLESLTSVLPYIAKHPFLGVGNLSWQYQYSGFQAIFGKGFFIADIGIFGSLFVGGLFLIAIYTWLYIRMRKNLGALRLDTPYVAYLMFLIDYYLIQFLLLGEPMMLANCMSFAIIYYPLFAFKRPMNLR